MTNPVEHVVIMVKENHTFDNFFCTFPGANGTPALGPANDPIPLDPSHDHGGWLEAQLTSCGGIDLAYGKSDIPVYWALAQQYVLCDNYFTDVAGESEPNHLYLIAADSPIIDNDSKYPKYYQPQPPFDIPSLPQALETAGLTWRNYADPKMSYFTDIKTLESHPWNVPTAWFDADVESGTLPTVAWLYPPDGFTDHPPYEEPPPGSDPRVLPRGMRWTFDRIMKVAASPLWDRTAIFITWDDWGGWSDHVDPRFQRRWTGGGPKGYQNSQFRYGPRVPCIVVSPYAKRGVNSEFFSHVSIIKFCLRLFPDVEPWNAPALRHDDPSGDMWSCFDFEARPKLEVPTSEPT